MIDKGKSKPGMLYMVASIFNKGIAFLTIPLFTRILTTSDYGIVSTYSSWVAIVSVIVGMSLNTAIRLSRGKDASVKIDKHEELSTIFTFTLFVGVLFSLVGTVIWLLLGINISIILLILCLLEGLFGWLITDYTYYQMMEYKYVGRTALMILPNLIAALLSVLLILSLSDEKYWGRIIPLSLSHAVIGFVLCFLVFTKCKPSINKRYLKWALKVSLPLVFHGLALNLLLQSDRIMISSLRDTSETGIYSLMYSFSTLAVVITSGLEGIWTPFFTNRMNNRKREEINEHAKDYVNLICYAMVGIIMLSPDLMKFMAPSEYLVGINVLPFLVLADFFAFGYTFYVDVEYYYENTKFITINTCIAAVINIILNYFFIPKYGYVAAAFTTLVSYIISFSLHFMYAKKIDGALFNIKIFIRPIVILMITTVVFFYTLDFVFIRWTVLAIFILLMFYIERNRIKKYLF